MLVVLIYSTLFGAGLLLFRSHSPLFRPRGTARPAEAGRRDPAGGSGTTPPPAASTGVRDSDAPPPPAMRRAALLAGEDVPPAARDEYARRISAEGCSCGCNLTVRVCLARDSSCSRSVGLAEKIRDSLRGLR